MCSRSNFCSGRFFYGLIPGVVLPKNRLREVGSKMVNVQSIPSPAIHADERSQEADHPSSKLALFGANQPLKLDCGIDLTPFQIAYQTYGALNADRSNPILLSHALT